MAKTPLDYVEIEIDLRHGFDLDAFTAAIEPPEDVAGQLSPHAAEMEDGWERRLHAWGWGSAGGPTTDRSTRTPYTIGPYGDWTWLEDDERLMAAIAPFVLQGSRMVFQVGDASGPGNPVYPSDEYEAWEFDGIRVNRRKVDKIVTYE